MFFRQIMASIIDRVAVFLLTPYADIFSLQRGSPNAFLAVIDHSENKNHYKFNSVLSFSSLFRRRVHNEALQSRNAKNSVIFGAFHEFIHHHQDSLCFHSFKATLFSCSLSFCYKNLSSSGGNKADISECVREK